MRIAGLVLLCSLSAAACQVPVFRYALERWTADPYDLVLVSHRPLNAAEQAIRDQLEEARASANLSVHSDRESWEQAFDSVKPDDPPQLLLFYPGKSVTPFWQGDLTAENVTRIIDSPMRRQVVADLLAGTSTVWIQIDSGEDARDQAAFEALSKHLAVAAERTRIPEGVVPIDQGPGEDPIDLDDVLRSNIPLQIAFTTYRLSRDDPAEAVFAAMLQGLSPALIGLGQPVAVPVFGRGRALEGIPAEAVNADTIAGATGYLCAACSCQVKSENPGLDMLMAVDWDQHMIGNLIIEDKSLPPLAGFNEGSNSAAITRDPAPTESAWRTTILLTLLAVVLVVAVITRLLLGRKVE
jgi:hypothetical protein